MKHSLLRILSALLCMALLTSATPVFSEEAAAPAIKAIETSEIIEESTPEPTPAPSAEPTAEPSAEPAPELTPAPEESAAPAETQAPAETPSESPAATELPAVSASPEVEAEAGVMLLSIADLTMVVEEWIFDLYEKNYSTEYQQAFWLYKQLIASVKPDNSNSAAETAEAALLDGKAGSLGFALAFEALLDAANIANVVVLEKGDSDEAWNVVRLDGKWTHVDAFTDARSGKTGEHFGLTDGAMARLRSWNRSSASSCTSSATNYYVREKSYTPCENADALFDLLLEAVDNRTEQLKLYWAGEDSDLSADFASRVLQVVSPQVRVSYDEDGCYCILMLDHSKSPVVTASPSGTASPTSAPTFAPDAPVEIIPAVEAVTLGVGEEYALEWEFIPEGAEAGLRFSSSASKYASVNAKGVISANKAGSATITIKSDNGLECSVKVTVKSAPKKISFIAENTELGVGESTATSYSFNSGAGGSVTYSSADESIAIIDGDGVITAIAPGEVKITITAYNGVSKTGVITVYEAPDSIELSESEISLAAGDSFRLSYSLGGSEYGEVKFASSDEAIATVTAKGKVQAIRQGTAVITASTVNGLSASCIVNVASAPEAVTLLAERTTIGVGEKLQLSAAFQPEGVVGSLDYSSSNSKYISVSDAGVVTGKRAGSATITAKTYNGKEGSIKLTVKAAPKSIGLSAESTTLGVGESTQLTVTLPSGSAGGYTITSADESKLVIDASGLATAIAPGNVQVTATAYNGVKKSGTISIICEPETITLSENNISISAGDSWTIGYTLNEGASSEISYSSSAPEIASVDGRGKISAHKAGFAIITATTYNGISAQCSVEVIAAPTEVILSAPRTEIGVGESMQLSASILPDGTMGTLEFASSNSKYVSVDENGVVTGIRTGSATIMVKTYNGVKNTLKITVKASPKTISLSCERSTLGLGETVQLSAAIPSGSAGAYSIVSADESILSIDENGLATALSTGEVKVAAVAYNGVKKTGTITVLEAPESLVLSPEVLALGLGESASLSAVLSDGSAGAVHYVSENPQIASVDPASGLVTANALGSCRILAETYNGVSAVATVEVRPLPTYLRLPYEKLEIGLGDTVQIVPEVDPGCAAVFSFASASSRFARIDEQGYLTGVRTGTTEIRIQTSNGLELIFTVKVRNAPSAVRLSPEEITLGVGESMQLAAELPSGSAGSVVFDALDPAIATVDANGVITAHATGETEIFVETYNGVSASGRLTVVAAPEVVKVNAPEKMGVGQEAQLEAVFLPEGSHSTVTYEIIDGSCVEIDSTGRIVALSEGSATIRARSHVEGVYDQFKIQVKPAPTAISFDAEEYEVVMDQALQLAPVLSPKSAVTQLSYTIERAGFFTIDADGVVHPIMRGTTRVKVETHNGLSAVITIHVIDPYFPEELSFVDTPPAYLEVGDTYTPIIGVYPETAIAALKWTSSDPDIASVDPETGLLSAESHGTATIQAVSERNPALMLSYKIVVLSPERCLTMPSRRTNTNKISTTLSQIKQVRSSAYRELESLYTRGEISKSEYNTRQTIISRAFDMYLFPWMTLQEEPYWKEANSENGAKDFKPDIVYYGLPYTQTNRRHNVSSAVSAGYFKDTGKGYYLLNNDKFAARAYAGNDCSSYASMCIWGTGNAHSYDSTRDIATTSVYKTLSDWDALRPGDLLNKYNSHVVIFLYWANEAHTQMVIIEQGGGEAATNTVSASIRKTSYYQDKGYSIRRLANLS